MGLSGLPCGGTGWIGRTSEPTKSVPLGPSTPATRLMGTASPRALSADDVELVAFGVQQRRPPHASLVEVAHPFCARRGGAAHRGCAVVGGQVGVTAVLGRLGFGNLDEHPPRAEVVLDGETDGGEVRVAAIIDRAPEQLRPEPCQGKGVVAVEGHGVKRDGHAVTRSSVRWMATAPNCMNWSTAAPTSSGATSAIHISRLCSPLSATTCIDAWW